MEILLDLTSGFGSVHEVNADGDQLLVVVVTKSLFNSPKGASAEASLFARQLVSAHLRFISERINVTVILSC